MSSPGLDVGWVVQTVSLYSASFWEVRPVDIVSRRIHDSHATLNLVDLAAVSAKADPTRVYIFPLSSSQAFLLLPLQFCLGFTIPSCTI